MHEQSETVGRDGKFYNVYGANTPKAGQVLPGEPAYNTLKEAVTAAENRSEQYGHKHNPEGNKMVDEIEEPKGKNIADFKAQRADRVRDRAEAVAPTTASGMGDGRLEFPSFPSISPDQRKTEAKDAQEARDVVAAQARKKYTGVKKYASGGSIRGGGIESRGKTKGRFV
jgi:hypothetical protein